ncbi:type VI secretion system tip protein VgrG [Aureivirga marina]|uniref:type VI secretion system tip protein VgrG n=1 Tax=Aureivirga marina TaxID=1182451 RepID=UPI0018CA0E0E|nr:type VI secretion system tip protein VgrG [Aureivirga marina]
MAAESPITKDIGIVTYEITSNGSAIDESYEVTYIEIENEVNKIPKATLKLFYTAERQEQFSISNADTFVLGNEVEIKVGYREQNNLLFSGVIVKHGMSFNDEDFPTLEIFLQDKSVNLSIGRVNKYYAEKKDSEIIEEIISSASLTADVEATDTQYQMLVQHYCSNWDFMLLRADLNGKIVTISNGTVSVKAPNISDDAKLLLTYGVDIVSFNLEINSETQYPKSQGFGWDLSTQEIIQTESSNPDVNEQGNITSSTISSDLGTQSETLQTYAEVEEATLKSWADAGLQKSWMNRITGTISFQGSTKVVAGDLIELSGVGDRFEGKAFISKVEQMIDNGDWITTVTIGLSEEWYAEKNKVEAPNTSGLLSGVQGLMIGKVKQLEQDPKEYYRILVTFPLMQDDTNGVWARLSNFYATDTAGIFFLPEIDDEVVVGFLNNDPTSPIILGSLYSSKLKPGNDYNGDAYTMENTNYTKAILTKANNRVEFDDENKIITIATLSKNEVILDEKNKGITIQDMNSNKILLNEDGITIQDKNDNQIVMSSSGIEIKSNNDISISGQNISEKASVGLSMEGSSSVSTKGAQISNEADAAFSAKGNASVEVSSSGTTTVKGTLVMIN